MKLKFVLKLHTEEGVTITTLKDCSFKVGDTVRFTTTARTLFSLLITNPTAIITKLIVNKSTMNSPSVAAKLKGIKSVFNFKWLLHNIEYKLL